MPAWAYTPPVAGPSQPSQSFPGSRFTADNGASERTESGNDEGTPGQPQVRPDLLELRLLDPARGQEVPAAAPGAVDRGRADAETLEAEAPRLERGSLDRSRAPALGRGDAHGHARAVRLAPRGPA